MKKFSIILALAALFAACEQKPAPKAPAAPVSGEENAQPKSAEPNKAVDNAKPASPAPANGSNQPAAPK